MPLWWCTVRNDEDGFETCWQARVGSVDGLSNWRLEAHDGLLTGCKRNEGDNDAKTPAWIQIVVIWTLNQHHSSWRFPVARHHTVPVLA